MTYYQPTIFPPLLNNPLLFISFVSETQLSVCCAFFINHLYMWVYDFMDLQLSTLLAFVFYFIFGIFVFLTEPEWDLYLRNSCVLLSFRLLSSIQVPVVLPVLNYQVCQLRLLCHICNPFCCIIICKEYVSDNFDSIWS